MRRLFSRARGRAAAVLLSATAVLLGLGLTSAAQAAPTTGDPFGQVDRVAGVPDGISLRGWAIDPDTAAPIYVWVTANGSGRHLYAAGNRPDVGRVYPDHGARHGYAAFLAARPGGHRVCVTASDVGPGDHAQLGCRDVSVPGGDPFGNVERLAGVEGGVELKGWAIDPDTTSPIYLWVTVDGNGEHVRASASRPDVGRAFPLYGDRHGFRAVVSAPPGTHRVCVTASDVGAGDHRTLACGVVTTPGPEVSAGGAEAEILRLTNEARAEHGLAPLALSSCAAQEAVVRAEDLVGSPALEHAPLEPVLEACAPAARAAENLARGFTTAENMVQAWLDSPPHRANLLDPGLDRLGVGCVPTSRTLLCAQVFLG